MFMALTSMTGAPPPRDCYLILVKCSDLSIIDLLFALTKAVDTHLMTGFNLPVLVKNSLLNSYIMLHNGVDFEIAGYIN